MKYLRIVNRTRDSILGTRVGLADQWWQRARGFMRRPEPMAGEGLLLSPCRAVHMLWMRYALDIIFLDRFGRVTAFYPALAPGRRTAWHRSARYALEVPAGTVHASNTREGDFVAWLPADLPWANGETGAATADRAFVGPTMSRPEEQVEK